MLLLNATGKVQLCKIKVPQLSAQVEKKKKHK